MPSDNAYNTQLWYKFFILFSVPRNVAVFTKITPKDTPNIISCFDGLRMLSMSWVVLGHTYDNYEVQIPVLNGIDADKLVRDFF